MKGPMFRPRGIELAALLRPAASAPGTQSAGVKGAAASEVPTSSGCDAPSNDATTDGALLPLGRVQGIPVRRWESQLEHWLSGAPIDAPAKSWQRRFWQWCVGRPFLALHLVLGAAALIGCATFTSLAYFRVVGELRTATGQREALEAQCAAADHRAAQCSADAQAACRQAEVDVAESRRLAEAEARSRAATETELRQSQVEYQKSQRQLAAAGQEIRRSLAQELAQRSQQRMVDHPLEALVLAAAAAQATLPQKESPPAEVEPALRGALARLGPPQFSIPSLGPPAMVVSPDLRWLATVGDDNSVRLWNLMTGESRNPPLEPQAQTEQISALAFDPQGRRLAALTAARDVRLWNLDGTESAAPALLRSSLSHVAMMAFSPKGQWLALCGDRGLSHEYSILLWDLTAKESIPRMLRGHTERILAATFSSDDRWLITAGEDRSVLLWDTASATPHNPLVALAGHDSWVDRLAVTHDGQRLVSGGTDGTVRIWALPQDAPPAAPLVLRGSSGWITALAISSDDRWLATAHSDDTVHLWDLALEDPHRGHMVLTGHHDRIRALAFAPDGQRLLSAGADDAIRLWDLTRFEPLPKMTELAGHAEPIDFLAVSPDSRWLISASDGTQRNRTATVHVWALGVEGLVESARLVTTHRVPAAQRLEILQAAHAPAALQR